MSTTLIIVCVLGGGAGFGLVLIGLLWWCWGRETEDEDTSGVDCSAGVRAAGGWDFAADADEGSTCD